MFCVYAEEKQNSQGMTYQEILTKFGKISGLVMADYYYVVQDHKNDIEDENGFWFRRIYLTFDKPLNEDVKTRFRLEFNSKGDFKDEKDKIVGFVKDAWISYRFYQRHKVIFGLSSTPTWDLIEHHWGYRSVEKTPLDLFKFGGSRDFGVALKGYFDEQQHFGYHVMVGNGSGPKNETNKGKKVHGAFWYSPNKSYVFQILADYEDRTGQTDRYTLQAFAGGKWDFGRAGILFAHQNREQGAGMSDLNLEILSGYVVINLADKWRVFGRVDRMFDRSPDGDDIPYIPIATTAKPTFILGGLDYEPFKNVHIMPNVEAVIYDSEVGDNVDNDLIARATVFYKF
ncbi:MAG: hypothetical protein D6780_06145 [Candidatus Dadabacteria bacterium]|nr:MAG: hypothetical protein D6780_06145 [Candidatus Dadabacteria bacterium]